jgi:hypothetical protein
MLLFSHGVTPPPPPPPPSPPYQVFLEELFSETHLSFGVHGREVAWGSGGDRGKGGDHRVTTFAMFLTRYGKDLVIQGAREARVDAALDALG